MRILLLIPKDEHVNHRESMIPLGTAYINGILRARGFDVISCNLNYIEEKIDIFLKGVIDEKAIDVILCGGTSYDYSALRYIFRIVKQFKPKIITIAGGAGYTAQPYLFSQMTNPDYVVIGEGEETICDLLLCLEKGDNPNNTKGILYKDGEKYIATSSRSVIEDVNSIPFPSYSGFNVDKLFDDLQDYDNASHFDYEILNNPRVLPMLFGRSCPYSCKFCFHTIGKKYRARSLDNFFEELDYLIDMYSISGITIMDEFFGVKESVIYDFCNRIKPYHINWFAEIRVDVATYPILKAMKEAGCTNILMGLESMDNSILADMKKKITPEQIATALEIAYNLGLTISGNFIIGSEMETEGTFFKTFDWWNTHRQYQIQLVFLQLYPGTEYYKNAVKRGLIIDEELFIKSSLPEINISKLSNYQWEKARRMVFFSQIDHVMDGIIESYDEAEDHIDFTLICRHCGNKFFKRTKWDMHYRHLKHYFKCPSCLHKSNFQIENEDRHIFEHELYKQNNINNVYGIDMAKWLEKKKYQNIILFGNGYNLMLMKKEIENAGKKIIALTDYNTISLLKYQRTLFKEPVICVNELHKIKNVDVVIICGTIEYANAFKHLRKEGYTGKIDSMVNAILQHEYFLESNIW